MMKKLLVLAAMAVVVLGLAFALNSLPASESPRVYASSLAGISGAGETEWIPNFQWGSGVGGWDEETIYLLDISADKMYEIPVGVPEKPRN